MAASCGRAPRGAIDREMAACVPADTVLLAGGDLDRLRAAPFYRAAAVPGLDAFAGASGLMVVWNGKELLFIARGKFADAPMGGTLIDSSLAVAGAPEAVRAAIAQHRTGRTGASELLERAEAIAAGRQVWAVAQGGGGWPLTGNAANLNRLLRLTDFVTMGATLTDRADLEIVGRCPTPDRARQLEETSRAMLSLASAAGIRLDSVQVRREDLAVHVTLSADAQAVGKLLR
ncbi:MAG TPA: hypothetical protein VE959_24600 [Bryobacteraceae bacterium]|nr:hypothetical protein [Bryobacteraceae bacterium]